MAIAQQICGMHNIETSTRGLIQSFQIVQFCDGFSMMQIAQSLYSRCDCKGTFLEQLLPLGPVNHITKA